MRKSSFRFACCFVLVNLFLSCAFAQSKAPYMISGSMVINQESVESITSFEFVFKNQSVKNVESFTIVFYLFDEDGNPLMNGKPNVVTTINANVEANEILESSFSLDKYISVIPDEPYQIDYLYISKIKYEDGSVWTDPFGLNSN